MDMRKILQAIDGVTAKTEVNSSDMKKFLTIVECKGPLNRSTSAEALTMQHYTGPKKTITAPVLNVAEGAKPSMIGKYFATVEQELKEAAERPNERATKLAKRIIERVTIGPDGKVTGGFKPQLSEPVPTAEPTPAPSNLKPGGATVEYGGETYNVMVFGDKSIRPRIARSDKVVSAKVYTMGNKMFVMLDAQAQEGLGESERTMSRAAKGYEKYGKAGMTALAKAGRDGASEKKLDTIRDKHDKYDSKVDEVAGPEKCWPGHRKVGTKPGTGKNAGKRVNDCEKIGEATSAAQQAAIAIAKKKAGKK